ncbi:MAG: SH3 domain-containing protein [Clostridiales bacterium]|nr:SH3 domain-containing protein [Clostridiales bacterium]
MSKGGVAVLVVAALVFAALGFVFGQVVQAANSNPGTLVTEGYVHQYVGVQLAEMQNNIDDLEMRILELSGTAAGIGTDPETPDNTGNSPGTTAVTPSPSTVKIQSGSVNVRSDSATTSSVVGSAKAGDVLTYLGQKNGSDGQAWYHVRLSDGTEGWVASWLCHDPE